MGRVAGRFAGVPIIVNGVRVADRRGGWRCWFDQISHRLADHHVCVSEGVRRFTAATTRIPVSRLSVIANGVTLDAAVAEPIERSVFGVPEHAALLLGVGRLDPQKGWFDLLDALALLRTRRELAAALKVLILGAGALHSELTAGIAARSLAGVVELLGWRADVPRFLRAADGLVLPSRWEGMPNVVLEAMAAGLPVIASDVEGVAELVVPGETGWRTTPANPSALAAALNEFLDDPARRRACGANARLRVARDFGLERMALAYHDLHERLLARPR